MKKLNLGAIIGMTLSMQALKIFSYTVGPNPEDPRMSLAVLYLWDFTTLIGLIIAFVWWLRKYEGK